MGLKDCIVWVNNYSFFGAEILDVSRRVNAASDSQLNVAWCDDLDTEVGCQITPRLYLIAHAPNPKQIVSPVAA